MDKQQVFCVAWEGTKGGGGFEWFLTPNASMREFHDVVVAHGHCAEVWRFSLDMAANATPAHVTAQLERTFENLGQGFNYDLLPGIIERHPARPLAN